MTGDAGGREVGRISIRAVPATGTFREDLLTDLRRIEKDLPRLTIGTDVDTTRLAAQVDSAVARAQRLAKNINIRTDVDGKPLDDLGRKIDDLGKKAKDAGNDLPNLHLGLVGIGTSALSALPGTLSLAGSLEKVAGAFGLVPGLIAAAGAGVATLAVGLNGVKTALSAKTAADPTKYAAALANLAPAARSAVTEISNLSATLHTLQQNVQQTLFAGMSAQVERLGGTLIPVLNAGMVGIARQANAAAVAFAEFATSAASVRDFGGTFANITAGFHNLVPAVSPLLAALRDVSAVSASFLPQLGAGISRAASAFASFVATARETGQLRTWIADGITAVKQLGSIAGSVLRTFQGIVEAAQSVGGGTLGGLAAVLKSVASTVNGPAFQTGLRSFFAGLQAGFAALSSAMPALGSALAALGPPLAALTEGIGKTLAQAIQSLAPTIVQMAPAFTTLATSLASLTSAAIATIAPVLTAVAQAAKFIVQDVPGAATALGALGVALLAVKAASSAGIDVNLTKIGKALKETFQSSTLGKAAIDQLDNFKLGLLGATDAAAPLATKVGRLASPIKEAGSAALAAVGGFTGVGLAIAAVAGTALIVNAHVNSMRNSIDNASEAAGRLKSSMDSSNSSLNSFVLANQRAVVEIGKLDAANQKAYLVQIGFDLVNEQGYTPQQAFAALQRLANAAGITLPITLTVGSLTDVQAQLQAIGTTAVEAAREIDKDPFGSWSLGASHANEQIQGVAKSAVDALNNDNWSGAVSQIQAFSKALQDSNVPIDAQQTAMLRLSQAFLKQTGYANLSIDKTSDLRTALQELTSAASGAPQPLKEYAQAVLDATGPTGDLGTGIQEVADQQKFMASDLAHSHVALSDAGRDMTTLAGASQHTASAAAVAASNVKLLANAYLSLNNAVLASIGGDIGMKAAQADAINQAVTLAQQLKKNGDTLSLTSAKGRENVAVVNSLAQSFAQAAQATIKWDQDHHKSTDDARADIESLRKSLIAQMIQAGVSRTEAKKLADTYLKMPKETTTEAKFKTAKAKADAAAYKQGLENTWKLLAGDASSSGVLIGQDLADGMSAGLRARAAYVAQQAGQLAEEAVAAARHAAQTHSPSKLMIAVGLDMGAGLAVGLAESVAGVQSAAAQVANAALASVTSALKTQPTTVTGLQAQYGTLRTAMLIAAQTSGQAASSYKAASSVLTAANLAVTDARNALAKYTQQQTIHNAAVSLSVTQAKAYLVNEIAVDRQNKASKSTIAALESQLHSLSSSHTSTAAAARLAAAVTKAAYQDQVKAAEAAAKSASTVASQMKAAADKAAQAAKDAASAAADAARSLVDALQQQANDLANSITQFRDQMTQAIEGGGIDFSKLILDPNGTNGGLGQLQVNLQAMLDQTKNFAADLQALAKAGASQDLISQIVGLGPDAGDALAQQLLAGGADAINSLNSLMTQIQAAAAAGAQGLTDTFYKPGADAIENFIKGMQKQFPELKAALQQIIDYVQSALTGMATNIGTSVSSLVSTYGSVALKDQRPDSAAITKATATVVKSSAMNFAAPPTGGAASNADVVAAVVENTQVNRQVLEAIGASNDKFVMLKRSGAV